MWLTQLCCDGNKVAKGWQCLRQVTDIYFSFSLCCQEEVVHILFSHVIRMVWSWKDGICISEEKQPDKVLAVWAEEKNFQALLHNLICPSPLDSGDSGDSCKSDPASVAASLKFTTKRWHVRVVQSQRNRPYTSFLPRQPHGLVPCRGIKAGDKNLAIKLERVQVLQWRDADCVHWWGSYSTYDVWGQPNTSILVLCAE